MLLLIGLLIHRQLLIDFYLCIGPQNFKILVTDFDFFDLIMIEVFSPACEFQSALLTHPLILLQIIQLLIQKHLSRLNIFVLFQFQRPRTATLRPSMINLHRIRSFYSALPFIFQLNSPTMNFIILQPESLASLRPLPLCGPP